MSVTAGQAASETRDGRGHTGVRVWPALIAVFAAFLIGLLPTLDDLLPKWLETHGYSHGVLVAAIS